jgi:DNA invertase Pin-like site-specific DNA recombinase
MELIREAGGKFRSLSEPWADTTTHAGKMIMTIFAGIAEFERDLIRERTSAGRESCPEKRSAIWTAAKAYFGSE